MTKATRLSECKLLKYRKWAQAHPRPNNLRVLGCGIGLLNFAVVGDINGVSTIHISSGDGDGVFYTL